MVRTIKVRYIFYAFLVDKNRRKIKLRDGARKKSWFVLLHFAGLHRENCNIRDDYSYKTWDKAVSKIRSILLNVNNDKEIPIVKAVRWKISIKSRLGTASRERLPFNAINAFGIIFIEIAVVGKKHSKRKSGKIAGKESEWESKEARERITSSLLTRFSNSHRSIKRFFDIISAELFISRYCLFTIESFQIVASLRWSANIDRISIGKRKVGK